MRLIGITIVTILFVLSQSYITTRNNRLYDQKNRERIFHGVNVVMKVPPYIPDTREFNTVNSFTEKDMMFLKSWGQNVIRLGVMWPGVEPQQGSYNQTYLSTMNRLVELAGQYGIYALVEFHQDLFSEKFCADGVPVWAIPKSISRGFPLPISKPGTFDNVTGMPTGKTCSGHSWGMFYTTFSVNEGFHALYNNKYKLLDKFTGYWSQVAKTFTNNQYVLAYELINEPWPGNMYNNPFIMIPHLSEMANLQRVYDHLSHAIRQIDPNHPICFEPVTWLNTISAGFSHPPGGSRYANQSILCYHYYNPPTVNAKGFMKARINDIKRLKTGGILSEFYIIRQEGQRNSVMMDECDNNLQSWIGWIYKPFSGYQQDHRTAQAIQNESNSQSFFYNDDGSVNVEAVRLIARTYAPIVAGETISQGYDAGTRDFLLVYHICLKCGQTIVFANQQIIYPKGLSINVLPRDRVTYEIFDENYIRISPTNLAQEGDRIMVSIIGL